MPNSHGSLGITIRPRDTTEISTSANLLLHIWQECNVAKLLIF